MARLYLILLESKDLTIVLIYLAIGEHRSKKIVSINCVSFCVLLVDRVISKAKKKIKSS